MPRTSSLTDEEILACIEQKYGSKYRLDKFMSYARVKVRLELEESHMIIGAGREAQGAVDNPLVRFNVGGLQVPVVPGSSLKGAIRNHLESLAIVRGDLPEKVTVGSEVFSCTGDVLAELYSAMKRGGIQGSPCPQDANLESCLISPIMILFGAPWIASRVYIGNFYPVNYSTTVLTRTAIDRFTMSVSPASLHKLEAIELGSVFEGIITLKNVIPNPNGDGVERYASELFRTLEEGIEIGGDKSRGAGFVRGEVVGGVLKVAEVEETDGERRVRLVRKEIIGFENGRFVL